MPQRKQSKGECVYCEQEKIKSQKKQKRPPQEERASPPFWQG